MNNILTYLDKCLVACPFKNKNRTREDIVNLLGIMISPLPKVVYINGQPFLFLDGYVPYEYKSKSYSVQVSIYVPPNYPESPPTAKIIPLPEKNIILTPKHPKIKDGYYMLNLKNWDSKSTMSDYVEILRCEFGDIPPVRYYQAPSQNNQQNNNLNTQTSQQNYNNYTQNSQKNNYYNQNSQQNNYYNQNSQQNNIYNQNSPQNSIYNQNSQQNNIYNQNTQQYSQQTNYFNQGYQKDQPLEPSIESKTKLAKIVEDQVRQIIKDKNDVYIKLQLENNQLQDENKSLGAKLNDSLNLQERSESEIKSLTSRIHDLDVWLLEHNQENLEVDIDKLTKLKDGRKDHLLQVMAEDVAYDEILYYLDEALKKNVIEVNEYIKTYKEIAHKQFLCKSLAKKIKN